MSKQSDLVGLAGDAANLETLAAGSAADIVALGNAYNAGALSNRNLIINGAMQVAQRGNYTITTTGSPEYGGTDRFHMWSYTGTEQVVGDVTQSTDVPSGQGFAYSRKFDVTTAESAVAADETLLIGYYIEAQNLQHLAYGTSNAKDVTVSFWFKSTKTGTYCFSINQPDGNRVYVKEYTVNASDTWEKKIITIPGDTSGTINNDNGRGLWLQWVLMAGSNRQGTGNAWRGSEFQLATSNQVNAVDSVSNNIYLTGVQLEVGTVATPFEHRSYAQELQLCMRYYQVAVGMWGFAYSNTATIFGWKPSVPFRASPSMGSTGNLKLDEPAIRNETQSTANFYSFNFDGNSGDHLMFGAGSFSGLNTGKPHYVRSDGGSTTWDAEL